MTTADHTPPATTQTDAVTDEAIEAAWTAMPYEQLQEALHHLQQMCRHRRWSRRPLTERKVYAMELADPNSRFIHHLEDGPVEVTATPAAA